MPKAKTSYATRQFQTVKKYRGRIKDSALVGLTASIIGMIGMFMFPAILKKIWVLPESAAQTMIDTIRQQSPAIYLLGTIIAAVIWVRSIGINVLIASLGGYIAKKRMKE